MVSVFAAKKDDGSLTVILVNRGDQAVKRPLQLANGDSYKLDLAVLFDKDHDKAEALKTTPSFKNGDMLELGPRSVLLYIFKP
jgi:hypothetical protein